MQGKVVHVGIIRLQTLIVTGLYQDSSGQTLENSVCWRIVAEHQNTVLGSQSFLFYSKLSAFYKQSMPYKKERAM